MSNPEPSKIPITTPFRFDLPQGDASEPDSLLDSLAELFVRAVIERRS